MSLDVERLMDDLIDMLEDDGSRMMKLLYAAYDREFRSLWGDDPIDFLFRLCVRKLESPDGKTAYAWGFIDEFEGEDDSDEDEGGEVERLLRPRPGRGDGGAHDTGVSPSVSGHRAG